MGSLISRFRRKPTTEEQLKKIEDGLRRIEDYKRSTERKHKKLVASLVIYSAALYILACVIVFVWYLPESWAIRLGLLIPLILVPVIVYYFQRLISKWFDSRMIKANEEYADLQRKKKDIIDSVMETETFNKAKEILSKYAPEKLDKKEQPSFPRLQSNTPDLRQRKPLQELKSEPKAPIRTKSEPVTSLVMVPRRDLSPVSSLRPGTPPVQRLPQPVFPKERGITDKLIEFMIGDGPGYRYALICTHCRGHNGMALKEEFPYMAFNCCYCNKYNPARSKRPVPPKLPAGPSSSTPALPAPSRQLELAEARRVIEETRAGPYQLQLSRKKPSDQRWLTPQIKSSNEDLALGTRLHFRSSETLIDSDSAFPKPIKIDDYLKQLDRQQGLRRDCDFGKMKLDKKPKDKRWLTPQVRNTGEDLATGMKFHFCSSDTLIDSEAVFPEPKIVCASMKFEQPKEEDNRAEDSEINNESNEVEEVKKESREDLNTVDESGTEDIQEEEKPTDIDKDE